MTRRSLLLSGVALALQRKKLDEAIQLIQNKTESGEVRAATLYVKCGSEVINKAFGAAKTPDAVFLMASLSKPMTATAVMILSDREELSLNDPVQKFIPEFQGGEKQRIKIRNLLTHTSGLPDMLPEDQELRKRHAPLSDFMKTTCQTPLLFTPGTQVRYQSMGILTAATIVERITKKPLPEFLQREVFQPLGMKNTSLGMGGRRIADTMQSEVAPPTDWDWNSEYWRNLGSPWGGAHSTTADLARFLQYFAHPDVPVLKPPTAAAMITNQNTGLNRAWGLGWSMGSGFGKNSSPRTFGHGGSTGNLAWLDPEKDLTFVLLTTKPAAVSQKMLLTPVSDTVSAAA